MPLVTTKKMFEMAYKNGYAVGAFNVNNMEITQGIIEAVAEEKAPLILQISKGARDYASNSYLTAIINVAVKENPDIPIATHLDHGDNFECCKQFVDDGFTSVMIDASKFPFEENIKMTREVVIYAHKHGVVVEAELGQLGGIEEHVVGVDDVDKHLTDPQLLVVDSPDVVRRQAVPLGLGAVEAMKLDGGGSTTAVVGRFVINHPTDGCARAVSNALLVMLASRPGGSVSQSGAAPPPKPSPRVGVKAPPIRKDNFPPPMVNE